MIRTCRELEDLLESTALRGRATSEVPVPAHDAPALAIEITAQDALDGWRLLRDRLEETGRWPVVMVGWSGAMMEDWESGVAEEIFFLRTPYQQEAGLFRRNVSPASVVAESGTVDLEAALERHAERRLRGRPLSDLVDERIEVLRSDHGEEPDRSEIDRRITSGEIAGVGDVERWLLGWESRVVDAPRGPVQDGYLGGLEVLEYMPPALLLLPTSRGWESLAYSHFYGCESFGSDAGVALLKRWHDRWGAELVAHLGTMLRFEVARPPSRLADALPLAWEQENFAECTTVLPGISLLHHAQVLVGRRTWFLHERP